MQSESSKPAYKRIVLKLSGEALRERGARENPFREQLQALLMLALYRSGRQADALSTYAAARTALIDGLGIEPGVELGALERLVLEQDERLDQPWFLPYRSATLAITSAAGDAPRGAAAIVERSHPTGIVTMLFTDIEGSTRAWEEHPAQMQVALAAHDAVLTEGAEAAGGYVFKTVGDAFRVSFTDPAAAVGAAVAIQRRLGEHRWPEPAAVRVRMALHTGACVERDGDYFGPTVNRAARLEAVAHGGQVVVSNATAVALEGADLGGVSLRDLGEHRLRDLDGTEQVFQLVADGLPDDFAPLRSEGAGRASRLPETLGTFFGRDSEVREIGDALAEARVVTVTGPGGVGKTRLAIEAARRVGERFAEGVWMAELAPLPVGASPDTVAGSMALELDLSVANTTAVVDGLCALLCDQQRLVLLDNCEHLIDTAAAVASSIIRSCPDVRVLATSRAPLDIDGEAVIVVSPLALPDADSSRLMASPAAQLFVDRARSAGRSWFLTEAMEPVVGEICRRLDGMPLALELAAARVRAMPVDVIAARLGDRFALLRSGRRDATANQRTLWATIDWSYQLLARDSRRAMRLLSSFDGHFDLESVEALLRGTLDRAAPLDALLDLVDQSLVVATPDGYRMLETITQFGREQLDAEHELDASRDRLRIWAQSVVPDDYFELASHEWARIRAHYDTLRSMFDGAPSTDGELGELAMRLYGYWLWSSRLDEGIHVLGRCLEAAHDDDAAPHLMAKLAGLYGEAGDFASAEALNQRAGKVARERGMYELLIRVGYNRAFDLIREGRFAEAQAATDEGIAALVHLPPDSYWHSTIRCAAVQVAMHQGKFGRVRELLDEQAEALTRIEDVAEHFVWRYFHAVLALNELRPDEALRDIDEAIALTPTILAEHASVRLEVACHRVLAWCVAGDLARAGAEADELRRTLPSVETTGYIATAHHALGHLALHAGDPASAATEFQAGLGGRSGQTDAHNLEGLAIALDRLGDHDHAAALVRAAADARHEMGIAIVPLDRALLGERLAALLATEPAVRYADLDEAVEAAIRIIPA